MHIEPSKRQDIKHRAAKELRSYCYITLYLYVCLLIFYTSRTLMSESAGLAHSYEYGTAFIKALILAKFILLAHGLHYGERFRNRPLIYPTIYAALAFFLLLAVLSVAEAVLGAWLHGATTQQLWLEAAQKSVPMALANGLAMFIVLLNYFAFRNVAIYLGEGKLFALFFKERTDKGD